MPQPTYRDLRKFCDNDHWDSKKRTDHWRYTKRLADRRTLRAKVSFGSGEIGDPRLFAAILREQLQVSEAEFWRVVRDGGPARRPEAAIVTRATAPPLLSAATVLQLRKLGVSLDQVRALRSQSEAEDLLLRLREQRERRPLG